MYYGEIKNCDIANGEGVRVTLFVSGCTNRCQGCFQPETWDFHYGRMYTEETEREILEALKPEFIQGLTLLGGEPMETENQTELAGLLRKVRKTYPSKDIWCYTGYLFDRDILGTFCERWEQMEAFLSYLDVIVDGEFILAQKDISLRFRGSTNQRIIMVQEILFVAFSDYVAKGIIWPLFYTGAFYLIFVGLLTVLFHFLEKKMSFYKV